MIAIDIVLFGLFLTFPILTVIFIVRRSTRLALTFYFLSILMLGVMWAVPRLGRIDPVLGAKHKLAKDILVPYDELVYHLSVLSRENKHDQLDKALEMMSGNADSITKTIYDPNEFKLMTDKIIKHTSSTQ